MTQDFGYQIQLHFLFFNHIIMERESWDEWESTPFHLERDSLSSHTRPSKSAVHCRPQGLASTTIVIHMVSHRDLHDLFLRGGQSFTLYVLRLFTGHARKDNLYNAMRLIAFPRTSDEFRFLLEGLASFRMSPILFIVKSYQRWHVAVWRNEKAKPAERLLALFKESFGRSRPWSGRL
jgi:hypothetical protein